MWLRAVRRGSPVVSQNSDVLHRPHHAVPSHPARRAEERIHWRAHPWRSATRKESAEQRSAVGSVLDMLSPTVQRRNSPDCSFQAHRRSTHGAMVPALCRALWAQLRLIRSRTSAMSSHPVERVRRSHGSVLYDCERWVARSLETRFPPRRSAETCMQY